MNRYRKNCVFYDAEFTCNRLPPPLVVRTRVLTSHSAYHCVKNSKPYVGLATALSADNGRPGWRCHTLIKVRLRCGCQQLARLFGLCLVGELQVALEEDGHVLEGKV